MTEDDVDFAVGAPDEQPLEQVLQAIADAAGGRVEQGVVVFPDDTELSLLDGRPVLPVRWVGTFSPPAGGMRLKTTEVAAAIRSATGWGVWLDMDQIPGALRYRFRG
jgi:hypothetical protein